jgi:hypothetical protein
MESKRIWHAFSVLMILVLCCSVTFAKAPAKNRATKGTTQLKSNYNDPLFGQTFTLGKTAPINITINSAEYTVGQVPIGNYVYMTNAGEKLLVLHYTLHNPNKTDYGLAWSTLEIFGVDANDKNWRYCADVGIEGTNASCYMSLKPGQKTRLFTIIKLPAAGALPKLVIQSRDRLVLRFNLLKKDAKGNLVNPVKPLPAPIADPADPTGGTALEAVPAQTGVYYPLRDLDARLDSATFSNAPIKNRPPKKGQRYLILAVTAKNRVLRDYGFVWSSIAPKLIDADGGSIRWNGDVLFASRDETAKSDIAPGGEFHVRYFFEVPENLPLKSASLQQGADGRAYVYDLSGVK